MLHHNALRNGTRQAFVGCPPRWPNRRACRLQPQAKGNSFRGLYDHPTNVPLQTGRLRVGDLHNVYYEVHGSPIGTPVVVVHGGPGAGCYVNHTRFFDLDHYKVILVDQRGCGRSTPRGCLADNNTAALVSDLDALRQHLGFEKWMLFGGSWGVTLSLAYATAHPRRVTAMILRGVCMMRQHEIDWMYGGGAGALKPWAWQRFLEHLDLEERCRPLVGYYGRLLSPDSSVRDAAAASWLEWEMSVGFDSRSQLLDWDGTRWRYETFPTPLESRSLPKEARLSAGASTHDQQVPESSDHATMDPLTARVLPVHAAPRTGSNAEEDRLRVLLERGLSYVGDAQMSTRTAQALLECHFSIHGAFLCGDSTANQVDVGGGGVLHKMPLLDRISELRNIPAIAVHGQLDLVCPPMTVFDLHKAWPEMQVRLVPGAGHSMYDPAITHELIEATTLMSHVHKRETVTKGPARHTVCPASNR